VISIRRDDDGLLLPVRVQPGAARQALEGEHQGRLKVALNAPPEKGKANKALLRYLAKTLGISRTSVALVSGHTNRNKLVALRDLSFSALAEALQREGGVQLKEEQ